MYRPFAQRIALIAALLAALPVGSHLAAADAALTLTADGRPRATIVLAEKPTAAAQLAAFELQHYLKKLSGAELPIVREPLPVDGTRILVGESEHLALDVGFRARQGRRDADSRRRKRGDTRAGPRQRRPQAV